MNAKVNPVREGCNQFNPSLNVHGVAEAIASYQFYGDCSGAVDDPFGFRWSIATQVEEVSPEEMKKREVEWLKENAT